MYNVAKGHPLPNVFICGENDQVVIGRLVQNEGMIRQNGVSTIVGYDDVGEILRIVSVLFVFLTVHNRFVSAEVVSSRKRSLIVTQRSDCNTVGHRCQINLRTRDQTTTM